MKTTRPAAARAAGVAFLLSASCAMIAAPSHAQQPATGAAYGVLVVVQDPNRPERPPSFHVHQLDGSDRPLLSCGVPPEKMVALRGQRVQAVGNVMPSGLCAVSLALGAPVITTLLPFDEAAGISMFGDVAGGNRGNHGYHWLQGAVTDIGSLGGGETHVAAVAASGSTLVGNSTRADGTRHAFRWRPGEAMFDLGTLGGASSQALGATTSGYAIVGSADAEDGIPRAVMWKNARPWRILGFTKTESYATATSREARWTVGYTVDGQGRRTGFITDTETTTMLPDEAEPTAVTDAGVVVGCRFDHVSRESGRPVRAFRWQAGVMEAVDPAWPGVTSDYSSCVRAVTPDGLTFAVEVRPENTSETAAGYVTAGQGVFVAPGPGNENGHPLTISGLSDDGLHMVGTVAITGKGHVAFIAGF